MECKSQSKWLQAVATLVASYSLRLKIGTIAASYYFCIGCDPLADKPRASPGFDPCLMLVVRTLRFSVGLGRRALLGGALRSGGSEQRLKHGGKCQWHPQGRATGRWCWALSLVGPPPGSDLQPGCVVGMREVTCQMCFLFYYHFLLALGLHRVLVQIVLLYPCLAVFHKLLLN